MHGCIKGYSRAIVYIKCFTNNLAGTVLQYFMDGIQEFGIPSRVRRDRKREYKNLEFHHELEEIGNVNVTRFMINQKGLNRESSIAGCSMHNQRIERL